MNQARQASNAPGELSIRPFYEPIPRGPFHFSRTTTTTSNFVLAVYGAAGAVEIRTSI